MTTVIGLVSILFLGIILLVSATPKSKFSRIVKITLANGLSGREIAEKRLRENGIYIVNGEWSMVKESPFYWKTSYNRVSFTIDHSLFTV